MSIGGTQYAQDKREVVYSGSSCENRNCSSTPDPKSPVLSEKASYGKSMAETEFTAESYFYAALEHLRRAQSRHIGRDYFLAHFLSGLAVECMLRAYRLRIDRKFDSRHDLRELAKNARFYDLVPSQQQIEYGVKFALLNERWRSNQRYMSEKQLKKYLSDLYADFDKRGDRFKNNSKAVYDLAFDIVSLGELKWNSKRR